MSQLRWENFSLGASLGDWGWGALADVPVVEDEVFWGRRWGFEDGETGAFSSLVGGEEAGLLGLIEVVKGLERGESGGGGTTGNEGESSRAGGELGEGFEAVAELDLGDEGGEAVARFFAPGEDDWAGFAIGREEGVEAREEAEVGSAEEGSGLGGAGNPEGGEAADSAVWEAEDGSAEDEEVVF